MQNGISSPASNYDEMTGWPGTIPPRRLREALTAIQEKKILELPQSSQIREDAMTILQVHRINMFSSTGQDAGEGQQENSPIQLGSSWTDIVLRARCQDNQDTLGGVIVWKHQEKSFEDRVIFQLARHHLWMGMNRVLPYMYGMGVLLLESHTLDAAPGLIIAQNTWDDYEQDFPGSELPPGQAELLRDILAWHGARDVRWIPRDTRLV